MFFSTVFMIGAVFILAACDDDTTGPGGTSYNLASVNGEELPYTDTVDMGADSLFHKVGGGNVTLVTSNAFTFQLRYNLDRNFPSSEDQLMLLTGTYNIVQDTVLNFTVTPVGGAPSFNITGDIRGDSITVPVVVSDFGTSPQLLVFKR